MHRYFQPASYFERGSPQSYDPVIVDLVDSLNESDFIMKKGSNIHFLPSKRQVRKLCESLVMLGDTILVNNLSEDDIHCMCLEIRVAQELTPEEHHSKYEHQ